MSHRISSLRSSLIILATTLGLLQSSLGQQWIATSAPNTNFTCLAESKDGLTIAAGTGNGPLYLSTNGGAAWFASTAPSNGWGSLACSDDASFIIANGAGGTYISRDSGDTWTHSSAGGGGLSCSSDGSKICTTEWFSPIRYSLDSGTNWSDSTSINGPWDWIASSADGTQVTAVEGNGGAGYRSTNSGIDWQPISIPGGNWARVISSADGTRLIAADTDSSSALGLLYISTNSGLNWNVLFSTPPTTGVYWGGLASSSDGNVLAFAKSGAYGTPGGSIFVSWNAGQNWFQSDAPFVDWASMTSSGDGARMLAATGNGIYVLDVGPGATLPALGTNGNALFQAVVNPAGNDTTAWFEWGPTPAHGNTTPPRSIGSGGLQMFTDSTNGLDLGTNYYFRLVVTNANGLSYGEDRIYRAPQIEIGETNIIIDFDVAFDPPGVLVVNEPGDVINTSGSVNSGVPGVYVVTYSTTNSLGIFGTATRTVTIRGPRAMTADSATNLVVFQSTFSGTGTNQMNQAVTNLSQAAAPGLWTDETHVIFPGGQEMFNRTAKTLSALTPLVQKGSLSASTFQQWGYRLAHADRLVAVTQINDALQSGVPTPRLASAAKSVLAGDKAISSGKFAAAIQHYNDAWKASARAAAKLN